MNVDKVLQQVNENWTIWSNMDRELPVADDFYERYAKARRMLQRVGVEVSLVFNEDEESVFVAVTQESNHYLFASIKEMRSTLADRNLKAESDRWNARYFDADGNFDIQRYYNDGFQKITWKDDES